MHYSGFKNGGPTGKQIETPFSKRFVLISEATEIKILCKHLWNSNIWYMQLVNPDRTN